MRATLWVLGIAGFLWFSTYAYKEVNANDTSKLTKSNAQLTKEATQLREENSNLLRRIISHKKAIKILRDDCQLPPKEPDQSMEMDQSFEPEFLGCFWSEPELDAA